MLPRSSRLPKPSLSSLYLERATRCESNLNNKSAITAFAFLELPRTLLHLGLISAAVSSDLVQLRQASQNLRTELKITFTMTTTQPVASTSYSSPAQQALGAIPLTRSKSVGSSSLFSGLTGISSTSSSSAVNNATAHSVATREALQRRNTTETRENRLHFATGTNTDNGGAVSRSSSQQAQGGAQSGYLEAKVVILGSQGQ